MAVAKAQPKLILSPSRDIAFDRLVLSQSNVRRVKAGVSIDALADDIARRTLLQSLSVRPILDGDGQESGRYEVPAGGRRYRALELLVKRKRLAKGAPIPCVVRTDETILAEEDSLAENAFREPLHPLDEFRAMQAMVDKQEGVEAIAAHFGTTPAVVRQRLKLASVSPALHALYADGDMSLDQLMAFTVADDHARQEAIWEQLKSSFDMSPRTIRRMLTEDSVRVGDKRARFVGVEAYLAAGGAIVRDLFEADDGGWLTDPALLNALVDEKLKVEAARIGGEGWKWVETAIELPWNATHALRRIVGEEVAMTAEERAALEALEEEADRLSQAWAEVHDIPDEVHARLDAIDVEIGALADRPMIYDPAELALAGAFVSIDPRGLLVVERGYVRAGDEPAEEKGGAADVRSDPDRDGGDGGDGAQAPVGDVPDGGGAGAETGEDGLKPLTDRVVSDLTAWRTLALQDAVAQSPETAYAAVLHALVLSTFYGYSRESCLQLSLQPVGFSHAPAGLRDAAPAGAIAERMEAWRARLPRSDKQLWAALLELGADDQAALFAHCASVGVNAQAEIVPKYDNGRISAHVVERRIAHSHVLARAVSLDLVDAGWRPTAGDYLGSVTKPRILADVAEARGPQFAEMIDHLKKGDMAREAERLLEEAGWLPEPMRTPEDASPASALSEEGGDPLPACLLAEEEDAGDDHDALAVAAE
jgi:ParB family chromosome partitioning protein